MSSIVRPLLACAGVEIANVACPTVTARNAGRADLFASTPSLHSQPASRAFNLIPTLKGLGPPAVCSTGGPDTQTIRRAPCATNQVIPYRRTASPGRADSRPTPKDPCVNVLGTVGSPTTNREDVAAYSRRSDWGKAVRAIPLLLAGPESAATTIALSREIPRTRPQPPTRRPACTPSVTSTSPGRPQRISDSSVTT